MDMQTGLFFRCCTVSSLTKVILHTPVDCPEATKSNQRWGHSSVLYTPRKGPAEMVVFGGMDYVTGECNDVFSYIQACKQLSVHSPGSILQHDQEVNEWRWRRSTGIHFTSLSLASLSWLVPCLPITSLQANIFQHPLTGPLVPKSLMGSRLCRHTIEGCCLPTLSLMGCQW